MIKADFINFLYSKLEIYRCIGILYLIFLAGNNKKKLTSEKIFHTRSVAKNNDDDVSDESVSNTATPAKHGIYLYIFVIFINI